MMERLIDAIATCIVGCQGRTNRDRALAVLAVIKEQGWAVVPNEPTPAMLQGACTTHKVGEPCRYFDARRAIWSRMIKAAKLTPPKEEA